MFFPSLEYLVIVAVDCLHFPYINWQIQFFLFFGSFEVNLFTLNFIMFSTSEQVTEVKSPILHTFPMCVFWSIEDEEGRNERKKKRRRKKQRMHAHIPFYMPIYMRL